MFEENPQFVAARQRMVDEQLIERGIRDSRVLDAMRRIPRHAFIPPEYHDLAYADGPLPIGNEQTISQPYIVALMTQLLKLTGDEVVLEIGTGSGYQAAVLAQLARHVHTIERFPELAENAKKVLEMLGIKNVTIHVGDGSRGLPQFAPFGAILVTAAAPRAPVALLRQLDAGGRMVIPVGPRGGQVLERWVHTPEGWKQESLTPVAFVPLLGEYGWKEE
jgi:protein-L-isoaspartate(D-aspartate) O-methyltransferase